MGKRICVCACDCMDNWVQWETVTVEWKAWEEKRLALRYFQSLPFTLHPSFPFSSFAFSLKDPLIVEYLVYAYVPFYACLIACIFASAKPFIKHIKNKEE